MTRARYRSLIGHCTCRYIDVYVTMVSMSARRARCSVLQRSRLTFGNGKSKERCGSSNRRTALTDTVWRRLGSSSSSVLRELAALTDDALAIETVAAVHAYSEERCAGLRIHFNTQPGGLTLANRSTPSTPQTHMPVPQLCAPVFLTCPRALISRSPAARSPT